MLGGLYNRKYESEKGNRHSLPLPGNRMHLPPAAPPPPPDGTTPNRSRQCKSVSAVQHRRRCPPDNRGDSQLAAGRPVALTTPTGRTALNMKKLFGHGSFFLKDRNRTYIGKLLIIV